MKQHTATQPVTPQLRQWIVDQAEAGHSADAILKSMRDAGWQADVAADAMESTLTRHLRQKGLPLPVPGVLPASMPQFTTAVRTVVKQPAAGAAAKAGPGDEVRVPVIVAPVRVPEPVAVEGAPFVDAGDRQVQILCSLRHPRVVVFGNLLSAEECEALIASARPRLDRSRTVEIDTGGEELNAARTSDGMFFQRGETELITRIEARIARLLNWPVVNGEGLQILNYRPGAEYKPHYDYFDPAASGSATILKRGGQRLATLVMYLNEPEQGGGTTFPDIQLEVAPQRGNAVFFSYDRPDPTTRTLHGGAPVLAGEKWVATKWLREGEFR
jgi:prolyl 4-hydroxylase